MKYAELKDRQQKEFNTFPIGFAFSKEQFTEEMERLGVTDKNDLLGIGGGGFIRAADKNAYIEMCARFTDEVNEEISADPTGAGFVADMFETELSNHEYIITGDLSETLDACGLTEKEVMETPKLKNGLEIALKNYRKNVIL